MGRNPQRAPQAGLGALLLGTGFTRSQDDAYPVQDYMASRDALHELDEKLQVGQASQARASTCSIAFYTALRAEPAPSPEL